jgi:hypothetical protein
LLHQEKCGRLAHSSDTGVLPFNARQKLPDCNGNLARRRRPKRRRFLAEFDAGLIKSIQLEAIERGTTPSALAEVAVAEWMRRKRTYWRLP